MIKFLVDENLPRALVKGLKRRRPDLDILRVHEAGLRGVRDPEILAFAAKQDRIVVSRDKATMKDYAAESIVAGRRMPGLLVVRPRSQLRALIEDMLLIAEASDTEEWRDQIHFLPL